MGDPITIGLIVASTAVTVAGSMQQASYLRAQAELEAQQRQENADLAKIEAQQQEAERLRTLRRTEKQQLATGAALGFDPTLSRSFFAITRDTREIAERDISNIRLNGLVTQGRELLAADAARLSGKAGAAAAQTKAFASILGAGEKIYKVSKET